MNVGNVYYVTSRYNENKFKSLLESQLAKSADTFPSHEFVEQALSAYLECKESGIQNNSIKQMENFLNTIKYVDRRDYLGNKTVGDPLEAIVAFNQVVIMYQLSKKKWRKQSKVFTLDCFHFRTYFFYFVLYFSYFFIDSFINKIYFFI